MQRLVCGDEQILPQTMERLAYYGLSLPERGAFVVVLVSMDDDANLGFQPVIQQLRHTDLLEMETMQSMVAYMPILQMI
ncbi:hypothetical protein [Paenibacillus qinlingensis]|uniref:hypothetical protein n=1 Tax=Paenibacillus qinlingensis TaxID=1837343 RepID=UPI0015667003|nr:hypothetical protein [Paenibacillus qinlingensis]